MSITVRPEEPGDASAVAETIKRAYEPVAYSNHREHLMVSRLRVSAASVPGLSLVAEVAGEIAGHLLLTKIHIRDGEKCHLSLALAPLSVAPEFQRRGVGKALVNEAHHRARQLGFGSIVVVGIAGYYAKFGYVPLRLFPIAIPFKVREENCAIVSLFEGGLSGMSGTVEYAPEWMER